MRKLSKVINKATKYRAWEKAQASKKHPSYNSEWKFHKDILYQLLIIQQGICAYTEFRLVSDTDIQRIKDDFKRGRYNGAHLKLPVDIEHFDSQLKKNYGWRWSNLFAVFDHVNQKVKRIEEAKILKAGSTVDNILKPDRRHYNPKKYLEFDFTLNTFVPNSSLSPQDKRRVEIMIKCLGLNCGFIKLKRAEYYNELVFRESMGETIVTNQFHTGWQLK